MLELPNLRQQTTQIVTALQRKGVATADQLVKDILALDEKRRHGLTELEKLRAEMNQTAKSIGQFMKSGDKEAANAAKARTGEIKSRIKELEEQQRQYDEQLQDQMVALPNTPHESVPEGKSSADNVTVSEVARIPVFDFDAKPHWELARAHDIIDWELGVKVTGAGFPVYKGKGARLQRALISFFLDRAAAQGYVEVQPPLVVNEASGFGTGQLPDKEGQMYHITKDELYLIPTAEVPITNLYRDEIIAEDQLPVKHCGYTPCFRREAGSYGKDVKGLNRLHQFDKVELVQVVHPNQSYDVLEQMTTYVESLLADLELPYRRLLLCTGDVSFASAKTFDLEVYSAAQERWLEVSSVSNFETFQSNRLKLRFRNKEGKKQLAHTLNGSALALPRIVAALLENHQRADGSIHIPEKLWDYTGFRQIG